MSLFPHSDHFPDEDLLCIINWSKTIIYPIDGVIPYPRSNTTYKLTFGILLRAYSGNRRVVKRGIVSPALYLSPLPSNVEISHNPVEINCEDQHKRLEVYNDSLQGTIHRCTCGGFDVCTDMYRYYTLHEEIPCWISSEQDIYECHDILNYAINLILYFIFRMSLSIS